MHHVSTEMSKISVKIFNYRITIPGCKDLKVQRNCKYVGPRTVSSRELGLHNGPSTRAHGKNNNAENSGGSREQIASDLLLWCSFSECPTDNVYRR